MGGQETVEFGQLRRVLEALRRAQFSGIEGPQSEFAEAYHVSQALHAVRERAELEGDTSLADIVSAFSGPAADAWAEHMTPNVNSDNSSCDDLPEHIRARAGTCELKRIRHHLETLRDTSPLFDTERWVRHFERGLAMMWELHAAGSDPMH